MPRLQQFRQGGVRSRSQLARGVVASLDVHHRFAWFYGYALGCSESKDASASFLLVVRDPHLKADLLTRAYAKLIRIELHPPWIHTDVGVRPIYDLGEELSPSIHPSLPVRNLLQVTRHSTTVSCQQDIRSSLNDLLRHGAIARYRGAILGYKGMNEIPIFGKSHARQILAKAQIR